MDTGLIVVGTGIQAVGQLTIEARTAIQKADTVFFLVTDPVTKTYLTRLNHNTVSLHDLYETNKPRMQSYVEMVDRITAEVYANKLVCVAFYGHPGVFAFPAHEAIHRVRSKGMYARMLPGISSEDCLFADLGLDPSWTGCQSFEATDFLLFNRTFDPRSSLILWQVGVIGDISFQEDGYNYRRGLEALTDRLHQVYDADHRVIVYEASHFPISQCRRDWVELRRLREITLTPESTLLVPPRSGAEPDPEMLAKLGMSKDKISRIKWRTFAGTFRGQSCNEPQN
jgi:precorrin-6B methylase 1